MKMNHSSTKKWITVETKKLYNKLTMNMDPNDENYQKVHIQFPNKIEANRFQGQVNVLNNLESDKDKFRNSFGNMTKQK